MNGPKPQASESSLSARLQAATIELHELEHMLRSGDFDPHFLRDFRAAIDHVRTTAWAVQQWIGLREQSSNAYAVLPVLSAERVRRSTQLVKDLLLDLEANEIGIETEGLKELFVALDSLHQCLALLCKGKR